VKTCNSRPPEKYPDYYKSDVNKTFGDTSDSCIAVEDEVIDNFDSMDAEQLNSFVKLLLSTRNGKCLFVCTVFADFFK